MMSVKMGFLDTLYFGSIISATDPVTSLAIFTDLNVDPMLNGLVLGKALLYFVVMVVTGRIRGVPSSPSSDGCSIFPSVKI